MGHSAASLYRYASMSWPFMKGSLGRFISRGIISGCGVFDEVVSDARVFALPRKSATPDGEAGAGTLGGGRAKLGFAGDTFDDVSELNDCDLDAMGTMRFLMFFREF